MSEDLHELEEGTEIREQRSSGERDDGIDPNMSGHTERGPDLNRRCYKKMNVAKMLFVVKIIIIRLKLFVVEKIIIKLKPYTFIFPFIWCASKISIDPFFFYPYRINIEEKCLIWNDNLDIMSKCFISVKVILIIGSLLSIIISTRRLEMIIWIFVLIFDLCLYLPTLLLMVDPTLADNISWYIDLMAKAMYPEPKQLWSSFYAANLYLLQYSVTVILIYMTFVRATKTSSRLAKATWAKVAFNLVLYIHGGHVFGSLWYSLAEVKLFDCWMKALREHFPDCNLYYCNSLGNSPSSQCNQLLDNFCSTKTKNTTFYDFGIYFDALDSGILGVSSLPRRILHGLRWGLQNLSGFGQNLQTSTDPWENIFVVSITIYGVVLFIFFIGNMQIYLQTETIRSEKVRKKKQEIEESKSFVKLSEKLQKQIKRYQPDKWHETICIHFDNLFNNLPEDLKRNTKRELCLKIFNKVDEFRGWNNNELLNKLCDFVKPISYNEHTQIIGKGSPINEMLFLVQGKLKRYSFKSVDNNTAYYETTIDLLEDDDFCGEELIDLFRVDRFASNFPISMRTIHTLTKVDAFALTFYDLQTVFIDRHKALISTEGQAAPAEPQPPAPTMQSQQQP